MATKRAVQQKSTAVTPPLGTATKSLAPAKWAVRRSATPVRKVRDEEAAGSNPVTPTLQPNSGGTASELHIGNGWSDSGPRRRRPRMSWTQRTLILQRTVLTEVKWRQDKGRVLPRVTTADGHHPGCYLNTRQSSAIPDGAKQAECRADLDPRLYACTGLHLISIGEGDAMSDAKDLGLRAVAYVRVSLEREDMISPELQMIAVSDYCKRHGYTIVRTIQDLDLSGRFWKRRQVEHAINMIEQNDADVLVVWRWSRVSRNRLDWAIAVDRVESVGGRLESATEAFDTTTAVGRFARGMLAEFSAFESDRMGDIWREVRERRVRLGLTPVGHEQLGYRKVGGHYLPDRRTGPILAQLYKRYNDGESFRSLARWLDRRRITVPRPKKQHAHWHQFQVACLMDRGFAAGHVLYKGDRFPGEHDALISKEVWDEYQRRRAASRKRRKVVPPGFLLSGLAWCTCGRPMTNSEAGKGYKRKYRCYVHPGPHKQKTIDEDRLHGLLFRWLVRLATDPVVGATARRAAINEPITTCAKLAISPGS
jgi:DNA invertase Pin-like site-specific DNA recombinase